MKLTLKEKKLVKEYAKKLVGKKKLNEDERSNLSDFTDEDRAQLQKILSPIEHIVDKAFEIVNEYDTEEWDSDARNATDDLRSIYNALRNFGIDIHE